MTDRIAVFGYGSLINPGSVEKTLGRPVEGREIEVCRLRDYQRVWNLADSVVDEEGNVRNAVFLNLRKHAGEEVNGICVAITREELAHLDRRERNYRRIDISEHLFTRLSREVYSYTGKPEWHARRDHHYVMAGYERLIEDGLRAWGPEFRERFERTTVAHSFPVLPGEYRFTEVPLLAKGGR